MTRMILARRAERSRQEGGVPIRDRAGRLQERMNSRQRHHTVRLRGLRGLGVVALILAFVAIAGPIQAQVSPERAQKTADAAIARLRSPYCPGLMLEVCPSSQAELLRDSIRAAAAQGQSAGQIVEGVLARHGEEWRAVPKRSGAGLLAWLILPLALLGGGLFLLRRLQVMRGQGPAYAPAAAPVSDDERAQLAAAMREFEQVEDLA